MEVYPFHHRNLLFNIFTELDLTFTEIRGILDSLMEANAFSRDKEQDASAGGTIYDIRLGAVQYTLDARILNGFSRSRPAFPVEGRQGGKGKKT
jgi:hypothetical protein